MPTRPPPQTVCHSPPCSDHPGAGAEEDADHDVLGDRQQPPLHQHQTAGEVLGVLDVEVRRVGRVLGQAERRVPVRGQRAVRVVGDAPGPAQHPDVEVEDGPGVATGHEDGHEGHEAEHHEGDPQERQDHVVRQRQQPLDQPEPAGGRGRLGVGLHVHRVVEGRRACGWVRCCHGRGPSLEAACLRASGPSSRGRQGRWSLRAPPARPLAAGRGPAVSPGWRRGRGPRSAGSARSGCNRSAPAGPAAPAPAGGPAGRGCSRAGGRSC